MKAVSLQALFDPPGGDKSVEFAMATEGALMLLIWGEVRAGLLKQGGACIYTCTRYGVATAGWTGLCLRVCYGSWWVSWGYLL